MLKSIEIYILLFFTYSFLGWVMESIGGILKVKKFVNRGFLIGPYCPVYGTGVVLISILLKNYTEDIFALFILSTVICGLLEYTTSYIMEKLFNARWWDYTNRKFNINGRICLETLIPFGIAGTTIICLINPFFINIYLKIPDLARDIITIILSFLFVIDIILSFKIIISFKGETYKEKDNTEEIGNKVKDKAEDVLMKAESDVIIFSRRLKVKGLKFQRTVKYHRTKMIGTLTESPRELAEKIRMQREAITERLINKKDEFDTQIKLKKSEWEMKQKESKQIFDQKIRKTKEEFETFQKSSIQKLDNTLKSIKNNSEEITKKVVENFKQKSVLRKRLMEAFPKLQVKQPKDKKKKNKKHIKLRQIKQGKLQKKPN